MARIPGVNGEGGRWGSWAREQRFFLQMASLAACTCLCLERLFTLSLEREREREDRVEGYSPEEAYIN